MKKNLLRTIGILNIIIGSLFILTIIGSLFGVPLIVSGILYLDYSSLNDEQLLSKRSSIRTWSIVFIFLNIISSILSFVVLGEIEKNDSKNENSNFRANFLLNLGMILILISGFMFASSSWGLIEDYIKSIILLLFGFIFIILSYMLSKKRELLYTSNSYFVIGCALIIACFYSCGYFSLFGDYFSLFGNGNKLFVAAVFFLSTLVLAISYKKFNNKFFLYTSFLTAFASFISLIINFVDNLDIFSIIFVSMLLILNLFNINKFKDFSYFCYIFSFIYFAFIFIENIISSNDILVLICNIVYILNLLILLFKTKKISCKIFMFITIPCLIFLYCYKQLPFNIAIISSSISIIIFYIFAYISKQKNSMFVPCLIITNCLLFVNSFISYFSDYCVIPVIICLLNVLISISVTFIKDYERKFLGELILQPVFIILLCSSTSFMLCNFTNLSFLSHIVIWSNIFLIVSVTIKNKTLKNTYFIFSYFLLLWCIIPINLNMLFRLNIIIMWTLGFLIVSIFDKDNWLKPVSFVFYLFGLISLYSMFNYITFNIQLALLAMIVFILISYIFRNNKLKLFTALMFVLLPYYNLINILDINSSVLHILRFVPYLFYTYIFTHVVTNKYKSFNTFLEIFIPLLVFIILIPEGSITVTIVVGIMSILMIVLDTIFGHNTLFIVGLIALILNIVFNLVKYWSVIPVWLYLLIGGLTIIFIITFQQVKKNN